MTSFDDFSLKIPLILATVIFMSNFSHMLRSVEHVLYPLGQALRVVGLNSQ